MSEEQSKIGELNQSNEDTFEVESKPLLLSEIEDDPSWVAVEEDLNTQHQIQNRYCFWFMKRQSAASKLINKYEDSIKSIGNFQTVEHFWRIYDHLIRPKDFKSSTIDYHIFKHGIKPTWEDPMNAKGGKWMVRLKKGLASMYWEELLIAIIGEQFDVGQEICGAVISIRGSEDIISIWNKTADNVEATNKIRDQMRRILQLPTFIVTEYKKHQDSLTDKSSFRNTTVYRAPSGRDANSTGNYNKSQSNSTDRGGNNDRPGYRSDRTEGRTFSRNTNNNNNNNSNEHGPVTRERTASLDNGNKPVQSGLNWQQQQQQQQSQSSNSTSTSNPSSSWKTREPRDKDHDKDSGNTGGTRESSSHSTWVRSKESESSGGWARGRAAVDAAEAGAAEPFKPRSSNTGSGTNSSGGGGGLNSSGSGGTGRQRTFDSNDQNNRKPSNLTATKTYNAAASTGASSRPSAGDLDKWTRGSKAADTVPAEKSSES